MTRHPAHAQLHSRIPPEWDKRNTERGKYDTHGDVRHSVGVSRPALEAKCAVVAREQAGEADEHLPERGVDVEVELAFEVVRAELAKVRLVPDDDVRLADLVEARPAREQRVHDRRDVLEVLHEELALLAPTCAIASEHVGLGSAYSKQNARTEDVPHWSGVVGVVCAAVRC